MKLCLLLFKFFFAGNTPLVCASNKTCCSRQLEEALEKRVVIEMKGRISTKYEEVEVSVLTLHQDLKGRKTAHYKMKLICLALTIQKH